MLYYASTNVKNMEIPDCSQQYYIQYGKAQVQCRMDLLKCLDNFYDHLDISYGPTDFESTYIFVCDY